MFDILSRSAGPLAVLDPAPGPEDAPPVPLERLEAQICDLPGLLPAPTCRFLILLGDFDAREGWASWDNSCATWLSWKCHGALTLYPAAGTPAPPAPSPPPPPRRNTT